MPKISEAIRPLRPLWATADEETVRLYHGHVMDVLRRLPERSVQMVVTSPPYHGLRDYGMCSCTMSRPSDYEVGSNTSNGSLPGGNSGSSRPSEPDPNCYKCNGTGRLLGPTQRWPEITYHPTSDSSEITIPASTESYGAESSLTAYIAHTVAILREIRRVLRDDGTVWWNIGSSYGSGAQWNAEPFKVALALQADGWILRQDIVWHKPSPMPESVTNRCTKSHEYIFLLAKKTVYYYDNEAIKENSITADLPPRTLSPKQAITEYDGMVSHNEDHASAVLGRVPYRNKRSVWTRSHTGYSGAHFAVYPPKLIEPCILAGTSAYGACSRCGTPWRRVVIRDRVTTRPGVDSKVFYGGVKGTPPGQSEQSDVRGRRSSGQTGAAGEPDARLGGQYAPPGQVPHSNVRLDGEVTGNRDPERHVTMTKTVGWEPGCSCFLSKERKCKECGADWSSLASDHTEGNLDQPRGKSTVIDQDGTHHGQNGRRGAATSMSNDRAARPIVASTYEREMPCQCFVGEVTPCTVLDPFLGSGTSALVALEHGRHVIGIDLSRDYMDKHAIPRISGYFLARPALAWMVPDKTSDK